MKYDSSELFECRSDFVFFRQWDGYMPGSQLDMHSSQV